MEYSQLYVNFASYAEEIISGKRRLVLVYHALAILYIALKALLSLHWIVDTDKSLGVRTHNHHMIKFKFFF